MAVLTSEQKSRINRIRQAQDSAIGYVDKGSAVAVNSVAALFRPWAMGAYVIGDLRNYNGCPVRCVQAHNSTGNPAWTPDVASLWAEYHGTSVDTARPYKAPTGAQDAYQKDEYIIWTDGKVYRCKQNACVWDPAALPSAWEKK